MITLRPSTLPGLFDPDQLDFEHQHRAGGNRTLGAVAVAEFGGNEELPLGADRHQLQRLVDLGKLNDNVRPEEIDLAKKQVLQVRTAIENARLRLDSLRIIVEGVSLD